MVICTSAGVYGDEIISATELNRHPGRVLDMALERPVTITRNDKSFALLPRDDMTRLVKVVNQINIVFEVLNVAYRLRLGEQIGTEHPYGWLNVFDTDELNELIEEVISAFRRTESDPGAWDTLNAVIHEWHESAIAIQSNELKNAFSDKDDEVLSLLCHSRQRKSGNRSERELLE